jgi:hypothetical protein
MEACCEGSRKAGFNFGGRKHVCSCGFFEEEIGKKITRFVIPNQRNIISFGGIHQGNNRLIS